MAITMRRGSDANFDPTKLVPGELAVLNTTKKIAVAFADGTVKYMQTEEDAVAYVEQSEYAAASAVSAATTANTAASAASSAAGQANTAASAASSAAGQANTAASAASESATAAIASATSVNSVFREVIGTFEIDAGTNNHLRIRVPEWDSDSFTPFVVSAKENYVLPSSGTMVYHGGALYLNDEASAYGEHLEFPSTEVTVAKGGLIEITYKTSMGVPYYKITDTNMNNITVPYKECIAKAEEALISATNANTAYQNASGAAQGASNYADNASTSATEAAESATAAIQAGDAKMTDLESRFTTLTTTQQQDAEVIDARKGKASLKAKLDDIDSQVAEKANKSEVTNVMTPKGNIAYASLPTTGNTIGWYYYCSDGDGTHGAGNYVWNGTTWYFGGTGDEGYSMVKSDLSWLKENNGYIKTAFTYTSGKYINASGVIESTGGYILSSPIAVSKGEKIIFTATGYLTVVGMISTCDSAGGNIKVKVPSIDSTEHDYIYTVETDGYVVLTCYTYQTPYSLTIGKAYTNSALNVRMSDTEDTLADSNVTYVPTYTITSGKYINYNGWVDSSAGFVYTSNIILRKGDKITLYAEGYNSAVAMIASLIIVNYHYTPLVVSVSGIKEYSYTNTSEVDIEITLSYKVDTLKGVKITNNIQEISERVVKLESYNNYTPSISMFSKVGVIGDSFATGVTYTTGDYANHPDISWCAVASRFYGFEWGRYSVGGLTTRSWLTNTEIGLSKLQSDAACGLYIILLGINDEYQLGTSYIGSESDIGTNNDTFYGNYSKIIDACIAKSGVTRVVLSTMATNNTASLQAFNTAIQNLATHYGIPCILQHEHEFFNSSFYKSSISYSHPTAVVYSAMAKVIPSMIEKAMEENQAYFNQYYKD